MNRDSDETVDVSGIPFELLTSRPPNYNQQGLASGAESLDLVRQLLGAARGEVHSHRLQDPGAGWGEWEWRGEWAEVGGGGDAAAAVAALDCLA